MFFRATQKLTSSLTKINVSLKVHCSLPELLVFFYMATVLKGADPGLQSRASDEYVYRIPSLNTR